MRTGFIYIDLGNIEFDDWSGTDITQYLSKKTKEQLRNVFLNIDSYQLDKTIIIKLYDNVTEAYMRGCVSQIIRKDEQAAYLTFVCESNILCLELDDDNTYHLMEVGGLLSIEEELNELNKLKTFVELPSWAIADGESHDITNTQLQELRNLIEYRGINLSTYNYVTTLQYEQSSVFRLIGGAYIDADDYYMLEINVNKSTMKYTITQREY